jgi:hypothetical protein
MKQRSEGRKRWLGTSLDIRLSHFEMIYIVYPEIADIKSDLENKEEVSRLCRSSFGYLILGGPGSGKTTLAKKINEWWPSVHTPEVTYRPVVAMHIPKPCTSANLFKELLRGLYDPDCEIGKERANRSRALHLLRECKTRFLIVDNFQDIPERRDVGGVRVIGNWFRDLNRPGF